MRTAYAAARPANEKRGDHEDSAVPCGNVLGRASLPGRGGTRQVILETDNLRLEIAADGSLRSLTAQAYGNRVRLDQASHAGGRRLSRRTVARRPAGRVCRERIARISRRGVLSGLRRVAGRRQADDAVRQGQRHGHVPGHDARRTTWRSTWCRSRASRSTASTCCNCASSGCRSSARGSTWPMTTSSASASAAAISERTPG